MRFDKKTFLILGVSKSGTAVAKYLLKNNATCWIYEELKNYKIDNNVSQLTSLGAVRISTEITDQELEKVDLCIISPGVPINHNLAIRIKKLHKNIIGELEFAYQLSSPIIVGVTGTNGKTTTVSIIDQIIENANRKHKLLGNIGTPFTCEIDDLDSQTVCVTEVSSFQLEGVNRFKPNIACVLNITPDHLERHYTMDNYVYLKKRILLNQSALDYAVLNYDEQIVRAFSQSTLAKVIFVSTKERVEGAYVLNGQIYYLDELILDVKDIPLVGEHNLYNCLFSIVVGKLLGISTSNIVNGIINFKGVKHRIQLVEEKNGIKYYNDSKSTNTSSTISAISSINFPIVLILGGSEKGEDYDKLFTKIKESPVKHVILTGASRYNMLNSAGKVGVKNITVTYDFINAFKIANMFAESGDVVLLSPACASFDCFNNYEERGDLFIKLVEAIN